jgi:glycosyltransferase involved in cell wall biosynthesis
MMSPEINAASITRHCRLELEDQFANSSKQPTVALLPWGDLFEDFFDTIGVSFETFRDEHMGSYMFGYINALKTAGFRTVLFFVSARVTRTLRFVHKPTGTQVCILPASKSYRAYYKFRQGARDASGVKGNQKFSEVYTVDRAHSSLVLTIKDTVKSLGSYLSIPWRAFAKELRREGCTMILCQEYEHPRFDLCVWLGKRLKLPVFATFQGGDAAQSWIERPFRSLAMKNCHGLIIATQTEIDRVQDAYTISVNKIRRVFNPIDLSVWQKCDQDKSRKALGIPSTAKVVVCHGRIEIERKGLDVLLAAWSHLCANYPNQDLRLLLVGTGSDAESLGQRLSSMRLSNIIWVNEFVRDRSIIQRYLSAADLYTLPSRHEGFPIAPLEAMACGLPVVAADAQGISDIFEQQEICGGFVVPRGDAIALATAIAKVLNDDDLRCHMGKAARQRVENDFSMNVIGQQLSSFFQFHRSIL